MADKTINTLDTELTTVGANDLIGVWDVAAAQYKKAKRSNVVGATITGGGTIALGGYTLTVPASGTAALLGVGNTFTQDQVISKAGAQLSLADGDNGASYGGRLIAGRNNNASTPAAGHVRLTNLSGGAYRIWPDASGILRIWTGDPTNANDTSGTVVGAQTSMAEAKLLADELTPIGEVLASIQQAAEQAVRRFSYRSGAFGGERFEGVVVDYAPRYGMDRDDEHPTGKSLNEITLLGDLLRAVAWLAERVAVLEK